MVSSAASSTSKIASDYIQKIEIYVFMKLFSKSLAFLRSFNDLKGVGVTHHGDRDGQHGGEHL